VSRTRGSRRALSAIARGPAAAGGALLLTACGRLDELTYQPETTPEQWCDQRPCVQVGDTVLNEPFGTFLIVLLAALWVVSGIHFLRTRRGQRSRGWLGAALILGGIGAALAGVSYQAFSYELKCAGLELCRLTNGWEVGYSVTQAFSVSALLIAVAYACTTDHLRRGLIIFAVLDAVAYVLVTVVGVLAPSAVLLSFPVLMLFAVPVILVVIVLSGLRYRSTRDPMDRSLVIAAVFLVLVQIAYFAYYAAGITAVLWDDGNGFYFSENDVLHIGMVLWLWYVVAVVGRHLRDASTGALTADG
jgi:hypothetical protein